MDEISQALKDDTVRSCLHTESKTHTSRENDICQGHGGVVVSGETWAKGYKVSFARSTDSVWTEREVHVT